jgi:hypothetical protein
MTGGVLENGFLAGGLTLIEIGMGRSTPSKIASPLPRTGRKESADLLAAEHAFSIDSLSYLFINRCTMNVPIWLRVREAARLNIQIDDGSTLLSSVDPSPWASRYYFSRLICDRS